MINFDGANVSERRKYDLLTFCKIIFGGPIGGLRSQLSGLRSQGSVSGLRSQVSVLRSQVYIYIYILYKYITYLALKTMIVQNNIKHINTIGFDIILYSLFSGLAILYIYITYTYVCTLIQCVYYNILSIFRTMSKRTRLAE